MRLFSRDFTDPVSLTLLCILGLLIVYFLIRWFRSSNRYSDSSDDYAKGCLEVVGFGCAVPLGLIFVLVLLLV